MAGKAEMAYASEIVRAATLIELGANIRILQSESGLARERLMRLYTEIKGVSPPRGMLPVSADWYMRSTPNVHASFFYSAYSFLRERAECSHFDALTKGYRLYLEHCQLQGTAVILNMARAWTLVRFIDSGTLGVKACTSCRGRFVASTESRTEGHACGFCTAHRLAGVRARTDRRLDEQAHCKAA